MTDTLTATGLAMEWRDAGRLVEYEASDGDSIVVYGTIDFDYDMAYLLRVDHDGGRKGCSWLAVRQLHVPHAGDPTGLLVEWLTEGPPEPFFDQQPWNALERFVEWARQVMSGSI